MSEGTPEYLVRLLRSAAAEKGCDGLVLAAPSSKSQSPFLTDRTSSYRVFSGTCIVYFAGR